MVGHDISQMFQLTEAMFDQNGNCTEDFTFNLASANGIESMVVSITSTNTEFMTSLEEMLPPSFDLCALTPQDGMVYSVLRSMGFPVGSDLKGKTSKNFDITNQMPMLYGYDGMHTFSFEMTDTKGNTTSAALRLLVDKAGESNAPTVVWRGYDINQPQMLTSDMQIDIDITSPTGIESFVVSIVSPELEPALPAIGLPQTFDLCNITDPALVTLLTDPIPLGLGFPVNGDVTGHTSLPFSITYFVSLLQNFPGEHKFILSITDMNGASTTKTVTLIVAAE